MQAKLDSALNKTSQDEETDVFNSLKDELEADSEKFFHAFIIPSYKEEAETLGETLQQLADHSDAKKRYLVFMAMEAHEEGSIEKAKGLIAKFGNNFKVMSYSHHVIKEHEAKGKASNVSWCGEHLEENEFKKHGISPDKVFVTVIDADSWVPEFYVKEMDDHIAAHPSDCHDYTYQPCQVFSRNWTDVPALARVYDQLHTEAQMSNIVSLDKQGVAISNYTMSFNMLKEIGFWDTCADAIGEDLHTFIKASFKTNGRIKTQPIFVPFGQLNVQTDKGYFAGIMARFWQAERHARGCADYAYVLNFLFRKDRPAMTFRTMKVVYMALELFMLPAFVPWCAMGFWISQYLMAHGYTEMTPNMVPDEWLSLLMAIGGWGMTAGWFVCFFFNKWGSKLYYNLDMSLWRIIELPVLILPILFTMTTPTFVIASFKIWLGKNDYNVAEKAVKHDYNYQAHQAIAQNVEESTNDSKVAL